MSQDSAKTKQQFEQEMMRSTGLSLNQVRQRLGSAFPTNEGGPGRGPRSIGIETSTPPTTKDPEVKLTVQAFPARTIVAAAPSGGGVQQPLPDVGQDIEDIIIGFNGTLKYTTLKGTIGDDV